MRIASLSPALTDLVRQLGAAASLVGVTSGCDLSSEKDVNAAIVTDSSPAKASSSELALQEFLSFEPVDLQALRDCKPDIVLALVPDEIILPGDPRGQAGAGAIELQDLKLKLSAALQNDKIKLVAVRPRTLEGIYSVYEEVGSAIGCRPAGHDRAQRLKSQLVNWADNFYDRMKNKKVTFLSSIAPFKLGGLWIPDMISLCSAVSQQRTSGQEDAEVTWDEILAFPPDVIIVAPRGMELKASLASFKELSKLKGWEELPAVVRGEVIFTDGIKHFYNPTDGLVDSMAVLLSGIAGFESGYIAERDTFYRLRWLELHRHRL